MQNRKNIEMNGRLRKDMRRTVKVPKNNKALGCLNRSAILRNIITGEAQSQAELCRRLHLNKATVSSMVSDLKKMDFVEEVGVGESTKAGGKRPVHLGAKEGIAHVLGIWLDGPVVEAYLLNLQGGIVRSERVVLREDQVPEQIPALLGDVINRLKFGFLAECPGAAIIATGVAIGAVVEPGSGIVRHNLFLRMKNVPLKEMLETRTGIPTFVEDTVVVSAINEHWFGAARGVDDFVYLRVLPFIRAVIFVDGEVYYGKHGLAGQVGWSLVRHGPRGEAELVADEIDHGIFGMPTISSKSMSRQTSGPDRHEQFQLAERFVERVERGDVTADEYDKLLSATAEIVVNVLVLHDPERIVVDSIPEAYQAAFLEKTHDIVESHHVDDFMPDFDIRCSTGADDRRGKGIVCMVLARTAREASGILIPE